MKIFNLVIRLLILLCILSQTTLAEQVPVEVLLAKQARELLGRREHTPIYRPITTCKVLEEPLNPKQKKREKSDTKKIKNKKREVCKTEVYREHVVAFTRDNKNILFTNIEHETCASISPAYKSFCIPLPSGKFNGVNTEVFMQDGYKVLAVKRIILDSLGVKQTAIYTPYSDELNTKAVQAYGKKYLESLVASSMRELREFEIKSLVNKSALVADRVPVHFPLVLAVIEHMDVDRFEAEPTTKLMGEVFVTLALNQELTYKYSKSSAKARGLYQVIPSTYHGLQKDYPHAGLHPSFIVGMSNHLNSVKAAILLMDHDVGMLKSPSDRQKLFDNKALMLDYVASSYNGGPKRAKSLLAKKLDLARDNQNPENRMYVHKARAVLKALGL